MHPSSTLWKHQKTSQCTLSLHPFSTPTYSIWDLQKLARSDLLRLSETMCRIIFFLKFPQYDKKTLCPFSLVTYYSTSKLYHLQFVQIPICL